MQYYGAVLVDPVEIPSTAEMSTSNAEFEVLLYEFKTDLNAYLASRVPNPRYPNAPFVRTLADAIAFNEAAKDPELKYFGQEIFLMAEQKGPLTEAAYLKALESARRMGRQEGIDAVMDKHGLDALVAPTGSPAWPTDLVNGDHFLGGSSSTAAVAGYPLISVPAGFVNGLPVGITFMGRAYSEPTLIKLAYGFEQVSKFRRAPQFISTLALNKRGKKR
jgi:amidase